MEGTERALYRYDGKTNNTPRARKLKKILEGLGHTDVHVWWEQMGPDYEMCGNSGGFMFVSDQMDIMPIGLSLNEAIESLKNNWYKVDENEQTI